MGWKKKSVKGKKEDMPTELYRHFGPEDELLYVGISVNALSRLKQHASGSNWSNQIEKVTIEKFDTREDALTAETEAIKRENPKHNIAKTNKPRATHGTANSDTLNTPDAIWSSRNKPDAIVAAGEIAERRFMGEQTLSLQAAKLFLLLLQEAGSDVVDDIQHRVPLSVLNETFHLSKTALRAAFEELEALCIAVFANIEEEKGPNLSDSKSAELRFRFSPALRTAVAQSRHWACLSRRAVLTFESRYTLALYSYLALRANRRNTSEDPISVGELRRLLNVPDGKLTNWSDLRRFALDRAKAEINQLAGFSFGYEEIKVGRKVGKVRLFWGLKDIEGLQAAEQAFQMTRVERTAQRRGVETIVDDRIEVAEGLAAINQIGEELK